VKILAVKTHGGKLSPDNRRVVCATLNWGGKLMRKLLLLLLFLPFQAHAATLVQHCVAQSPSGTPGAQASCSMTVGAGHILVVGSMGASSSLFTFDSLGLTYAVLVSRFDFVPALCGNCEAQILCTNTGAGGADTITTSTGAGFNGGRSEIVLEYSGATCTTNGTNSAVGVTGVGSSTISSGNVTTTATDLLVAFSYTIPSQTTAGSGFTFIDNVTFNATTAGNSATNYLTAEHQLSAPAGTYAGTFTDPGSDHWQALFAAFGTSAPSKVRHRAQVIRYRKPKKHKILLARNKSSEMVLWSEINTKGNCQVDGKHAER
jgi:hypothetical protein